MAAIVIEIVRLRVGTAAAAARAAAAATTELQTEATSPRPVAVEAQAVDGAPLQRELQPAIILRREVVEAVGVADELRLGRIHQVEPAAVVQVAGDGTHRVGHAIDRAGTAAEILPLVEVDAPPEAVRVAADIAHRRAPVGAQLPFH